jgi:membrane protein DedA with SNARE-associated domain
VNDSIEFLRANGTTVVFIAVLLEQMGLPIPCTPWLLAAGALAHTGRPSLVAVVALGALGASLGHLGWFFAGRRWGYGVLRVLCRISIEPDTCVQRTQGTFDRFGPWALVAAPFIPGLTTVAPPLAGLSGMRLWRYLALDAAGDVLWASTFVGLGYVFGDQVTWLLREAVVYGFSVLGVCLGLVFLWFLYKLAQRERVRRKLHVDRIQPAELRQMLDGPTPPLVLDLRHRRELVDDPHTLPGALQVSPADLPKRHGEIPRDRDLVLYCS